jgi:hypothetical protein
VVIIGGKPFLVDSVCQCKECRDADRRRAAGQYEAERRRQREWQEYEERLRREREEERRQAQERRAKRQAKVLERRRRNDMKRAAEAQQKMKEETEAETARREALKKRERRQQEAGSALFCFARHGDVEGMKELLAREATKVAELLQARDSRGGTVLHACVSHPGDEAAPARLAAAEFLLDFDAEQ